MNQRITSKKTDLGYGSCQFDLAEEEQIVPTWLVAMSNFLYRWTCFTYVVESLEKFSYFISSNTPLAYSLNLNIKKYK